VGREHIVFQFSGVRPLPRSTAKSTSQISRDHEIEVLSGEWTNLSFPIYSLVGGKWTSFRAFAEQVTDKALVFINLPRLKQTHDMPIGGGRGYPRTDDELKRQLESFVAWTGLSLEQVRVLFERYGTRTEAVATFMKRAADSPLKHVQGYTRREVAFLGVHEKCRHLDDLLLRRTMLAMLGRLSKEGVEELADVLGESLGWSAEQKKAEAERALHILADRHGVRL